MLFLSGYMGRPVLDAESHTIGKLVDLVAQLGPRYPPVVAARIRRADKSVIEVPWSAFRSFDPPQVILATPIAEVPQYVLGDRDVLLVRNVLDKQIVDLDGRRLIRVQDIELFRVYERLRLLGVDVSVSALLRRLGWMRLSDRVSSRYPPRSLAWSDIDLGSWRDPYVRLRVARSGLQRLHPADLAEIASTLPVGEARELFSALEHAVAADTLEEMTEDAQIRLLEALGVDSGAVLLSEMSPDDAADLISHLATEDAEALLTRMDAEDAQAVRSLLGYEEESAGGLMTTDTVTTPADESVEELISRLRTDLSPGDVVHEVYVVDEGGLLLGALTMTDLLVAPAEAPVRTVMRTDLVAASPDWPRDEVVEAFVKYNLVALPVRHEDGRLLGIITVDDVIDLLAPRDTRRDRPRFFGD
jgi:magnesium transporter